MSHSVRHSPFGLIGDPDVAANVRGFKDGRPTLMVSSRVLGSGTLVVRKGPDGGARIGIVRGANRLSNEVSPAPESEATADFWRQLDKSECQAVARALLALSWED